MFHIVLVHPEIPPNTGNIMRLARNTGCYLHLIEPLGFSLDDRRMRRAGLDYLDQQRLVCHSSWDNYLQAWPQARRFAFSTKHQLNYSQICYQAGDHLVFGSETRGLDENIRSSVPREQRLTLPMQADNRSLNLSNAVAIATYEAWRQTGFSGAAP